MNAARSLECFFFSVAAARLEWILPPTNQTLKEHWTHLCNDDGGLEFNFFWHPLFESPTADWHPLFQELLEFIKSKY